MGRLSLWVIGLLTLGLGTGAQGAVPGPARLERGSEPESGSSDRVPGRPGPSVPSHFPDIGEVELREYLSRVGVGELSGELVRSPNGLRVRLAMAGAEMQGAVGAPRLPVIRKLIEVTAGARLFVELRPEDRRVVSLDRFGNAARVLAVTRPVEKTPRVPPLRPRVEAGGAPGRTDEFRGARLPRRAVVAGKPAVFVEEEAVYGRDAFWPASAAKVGRRKVVRGRQVVPVEIYPVRYNPVRRKLEVWTRAELLLRVVGGSAEASERERERLGSGVHDERIGELVVSADPGSSQDPGGEEAIAGGAAAGAEGMLVVGTQELLDGLEELVDWREQSGFLVETLAMESLAPGVSAEELRALVLERYASWSAPALSYLLLVGDVESVPIFVGEADPGTQLTDHPYATLEGGDDLREIAVGRISVRSAEEAARVAEKIVAYERADFASDEWLGAASFIGTRDASYRVMIEKTHDEIIERWYAPAGYRETSWSHGGVSSDRHFHSFAPETWDLLSSIEEGRGVISYSGHGGALAWDGPTLAARVEGEELDQLPLDGRWPLVISNACNTGMLGHETCFGEAWLRASGGGAIAFLGASESTYWDEDDILERGLHERLQQSRRVDPLGVIVSESLAALAAELGDVPRVRYYHEVYNLLGDPALRVRTREPVALAVEAALSIPVGGGELALAVASERALLPGALAALRGGEVFEAGYTGSAGELSLLLDPAPSEPGPLTLTVSSPNAIPVELTIEVVPESGPHLAAAGLLLEEELGNGDGLPNPGETFVVSPSLRNVGLEAATQILATLGTTTPGSLSILDGEASFAELAPGELAEPGPGALRIFIRESAGDGAALSLHLDWSTGEGAAGRAAYSAIVHAPALRIRETRISGGSGDGVAVPGETIRLALGLENRGRAGTGPLEIELLPDGDPEAPYTLLSANSSAAAAPAGGTTETGEPGFEIAIHEGVADGSPALLTAQIRDLGSGRTEIEWFEFEVSSCRVRAGSDGAIPLADMGLVEAQLSFPRSVEISEVAVYVDITHTWRGDLRLTLLAPDGQQAGLFDREGGNADDLAGWFRAATPGAEGLAALAGGNAFGDWTLRVEDLATGDTGVLNSWRLEVCGPALPPEPALVLEGVRVRDSVSSCDGDGYLDTGETALVQLQIANHGSGPATALEINLGAAGRVAVLGEAVAVGELPAGGRETVAFEVLAGGVGCMEEGLFVASVDSAEGRWELEFSETLNLDLAQESRLESFELGGHAPAGWSHGASVGVDDWQISSAANATLGGAYSFFVSNTSSTKDAWLVTPVHELAAGAELTFRQRLRLEAGYDGAVLELAVEGSGEWVDLGGWILEGGYEATLPEGPLAGRPAWSASEHAWRSVRVGLGDWAGQRVRLRFRIACDAVVGAEGWWVDDVALPVVATACDGVSCAAPGEVRALRLRKEAGAVVLEWTDELMAAGYAVYGAPAAGAWESFEALVEAGGGKADAGFRDEGEEQLRFYLVQAEGPDGLGTIGHYGR